MFKDNKAFSSFSVNDIPKAKDFYGRILGMEVSDEMMGLLSIKIANGNSVIIYPKPNHTPATFTVLNFPVEDIEKSVSELKKLGVSMEIYDHSDFRTDKKGISESEGMKIAWFKDPAGNILSLIEEG